MLPWMQTCLEHTSIYMYIICNHLSEEDLLIGKVNIAVGFYKEWKTVIFAMEELDFSFSFLLLSTGRISLASSGENQFVLHM